MPELPKDFEDIRDSLEIKPVNGNTFVTLIAIDVEHPENNTHHYVRCFHGVSFGGYLYDPQNDAYLINCKHQLELGLITRALEISLPDTGWSVATPLPVPVILNHLSESQQKLLEKFTSEHPSDKFIIQYVQVRDCL
jgi:hypothetical protein